MFCQQQPNTSNPPQVNITGRFAFVEFRLPEYATAALQLNGQIALMGNTLKIARPSSYVDPSQASRLAVCVRLGGGCFVQQGVGGLGLCASCRLMTGTCVMTLQALSAPL